MNPILLLAALAVSAAAQTHTPTPTAGSSANPSVVAYSASDYDAFLRGHEKGEFTVEPGKAVRVGFTAGFDGEEGVCAIEELKDEPSGCRWNVWISARVDAPVLGAGRCWIWSAAAPSARVEWESESGKGCRLVPGERYQCIAGSAMKEGDKDCTAVLLPPDGSAAPGAAPAPVEARIGVAFDLRRGQSAKFPDEDATVKIKGFVNSPCPKGARCVWSGQSVVLELTIGGKVVPHGPSAPFQIETISSDYKTRARLLVTRPDPAETRPSRHR